MGYVENGYYDEGYIDTDTSTDFDIETALQSCKIDLINNFTSQLSLLDTEIDNKLSILQSAITNEFTGVHISINEQSTIIKQGIIDIQNTLDNLDVSVDLSSVNTQLTDIDTKLDNLDFSSIEDSLSNLQGFDFSGSLNGNGGTFPDNTSVSLDGYDGEFIVDSSNIMKYDENLHIVIYRVIKDGTYFNVPSNMVSLYIAPIE